MSEIGTGPMTDDLSGKVALVTGGASGIGLATARRFAQAGAQVLLADLDAAAGGRAVEGLAAEGLTATFVQADVACEDDVRRMVERALDVHGALHVLFNNAGVSSGSEPVTEVALEDWNRILAVNLTGTFLGMKHGIAAMLKGGGGSVINNASVFGLVGMAGQAAYTASKGGVLQLTRTAALEFAAKGVRVNAICPGFTETPILAKPTPAEATRMAMGRALTPLGRYAQPAEIAELALFLASSRAAYITGAVLPVDGGYLAR